MTSEIVEDWVSDGADQLSRVRVDPDRLLAETREVIGDNRVRTWRLLDTFIDRVARVGAAA